MAKPIGYIIDQGLSPIDSKPYVAILTLKTSNRKTGNMAQVWILRSDINPVEAVNTGEDYSICGSCPHRKKEGKRACYVNIGQAPNSVYKAFKKGRYTIASSKELRAAVAGRRVRWGAYGDPSILHASIVNEINSYASDHTGYTHQWRNDFASQFKGVFQASCDNIIDYLDASTLGWKTFSVVDTNYPIHNKKINKYAKQCPATVTNSVATCDSCTLCNGNKQDIFVVAHGSGAKHVASFI